MSMCVRRTCEFCGAEFLLRLSGNAPGSSECTSCGKRPTPPVTRPENLRPASEMFPGGLTIGMGPPYVVESVKLAPMKAPSSRIFEMASFPSVTIPIIGMLVDEGLLREVLHQMPPCRDCGHAAGAHEDGTCRGQEKGAGELQAAGIEPDYCECNEYVNPESTS